METAAIAFGSAIVGAVAVFAGTIFIELWRMRRARIGFLRALISELQRNAAAAIGVLYAGKLTATNFSDSTWQAVQFELAQFLEHTLYEDLSFVYLAMPGIERLAEEGWLPKALGGKEIIERWLTDTKDARMRVINLPQLRKFRAAFEREWESSGAKLADRIDEPVKQEVSKA